MRRSGWEIGRGRIDVRGILKNSPSHSKTSWLSARTTICAVSTKRPRASPMGIRMPAYSTLAAPRPNPSRRRPPARMSSRAISSARRTGSCHGSTITAVPRVTRFVRPAK
jgi:hypothetical protein